MATTQLDKTRDKYRSQVAISLQEDEDPLAAYVNFIQWTLDNYPGQLISRSGLLELLEETTRQFKDDDAYRGDLRYLKLWSSYASLVEDPAEVYAFLLRNGIGTVYAHVYEEYALALIAGGRNPEADKALRVGIRRNARPVERLKKRYAEFQSNKLQLPPPPDAKLWNDATPSTKELRKHPLKNYPEPSSKKSTSHHPSKHSAAKPDAQPAAKLVAPSAHAAPSSSSAPANFDEQDRYIYIRAHRDTGNRREKLRFNLSLLFTDDNVEYSVQEARARSMGLLGKKWGPPPSDVPKETAGKFKRGGGFAEPTVTLATKEALADVFGMYNSPEKTMRSATLAGSKYAPVKRLDPMTPRSMARLPPVMEGQDPDKTVMPPTKLAIDQNTKRKENSVPATTPKFKPFVDENSVKPSAVTPDPSRRVLSAKEPGSVLPKATENELRPKTPSTFRPLEEKPTAATPAGGTLASRPLSRQDIFTDDASTPSATNTTSRSRLMPFVDSQQGPLKVFSRPPSAASENTPAPRAALQALHSSTSRQPFVPVRSALAQSQAQSFSSSSSEDDAEQEQEQAQPTEIQEDYFDDSTTESDDIDDEGFVAIPQEGQLEEEEDSSAFEDEDDFSAPLPRRGHVNVMTPITERTYEYTSTTRNGGTPDDTGRTFPHVDPVDTAAQLVAELREDDDDDEMVDNEERTGTNLFEALSVAASFSPPNPCNPFDPSIMSTILSLIPTDPAFHDLRHAESATLDRLQKFAKKKSRRVSTTTIEDAVPIDLAGRPYAVVEKLGEGGFGAVFEAIDVHAAEQSRPQRNEDDEDDDDDEFEVPKVALKVVKPRNIWEFHVLRRIHLTLPTQLKRSIITPSALYAYRDESFLVMEYCNQGTLLDIVNNASKAGITQQGACLDELLVMFFSVELMRFLEGMHTSGFIHGDVKIDNCLLRLEDVPGPASAWTSVYQPSGDGGWAHKGIKTIDFGRTIDTRLFPITQRYTGDWPTDARDCLEMREGTPWTYQTDYFGLAGIIYCMLYGKYIETSSVVLASERYKLSVPFKRYWHVDLWTRLFDLLLNSGSVRPDGHLPLCEEMAALRTEMESWLQTNCNRGSNSLKGLLKKIGLSLLQ
ncbi:hypothetical protein EUX98_g969 [Antrodiella citrinella]|uniref:Protein kinase domain-containing protein n=1 Tax=Antrodiella citrinella TaxID=2447956 RepID=A0A4S4N2L3_9APHY|nr:hypothetical protein EUX98_g969 [Antrodiella citrinella]